MKKIIISSFIVLAVAAVAGYATYSYFSDTETSTGNTFTAGSIDLKVDSKATYDGADFPTGTWGQAENGVDIVGQKFFDFDDIKPGDFGENTISLHVINNDAWACVTIDNVIGRDNSCTEPEKEAEGGTVCDPNGNLAQNLYFTAWADDGDNIWEPGEPLLFENEKGLASDVLNGKTYALADSTTGTPITGGQTKYIGIKWCAGTMAISQGNDGARVISCDGSAMDNKSQTDSLIANVTFKVEQARNNPSFRCVPIDNNRETLVLENKDANYNRLTDDNTIGTLVFDKSGNTFNYDFDAHGLTANTNYSLIYYGDPWPGNHPGAFINQYLTDASGNISVVNQSKEISTDIAGAGDANGSNGKIWLIPSSAYDQVSKSVTTWPFTDKWLFESNLIHYDDTNN